MSTVKMGMACVFKQVIGADGLGLQREGVITEK